MVEKTGALKVNVFNTGEEVICIPARALGVRIFGAERYSVDGLPN